MVNKYWDPKYSELIGRVEAWNALEEGIYDNEDLRAYKSYKWHDLSEAQMEAQIEKAKADFEKYFYCPDCEKKSLIKDSVVKRKVMNTSFRLDNAAMPGWMKIQASTESCRLRFCPECANKTSERLTDREFSRAYDGNAFVGFDKKGQTSANSGCMVIAAAIITVVSAACWLVCLSIMT